MMHSTELTVVNEAFPTIGKTISILWGASCLPEYIDKLINDTRDGDRQGFPIEVFVALAKLREQHTIEFPQWGYPNKDVWNEQRSGKRVETKTHDRK